MIAYSFQRYLTAKKSVDDRALNGRVWEKLAQVLAEIQKQRPLRVLEIGAGVGTMVQRLLEAGLVRAGVYTAVDAQDENLRFAGDYLAAWGQEHESLQGVEPRSLTLRTPGGRLKVELQTADVYDFIGRAGGRQQWDLIVAHAFMDLVDAPQTLQLLKPLAAPGACFYLTINFDGLTIFEPLLDAELDAQILALYHQTMDERRVAGRRSGESRSGRRMFGWLQAAGFETLAAGSSDWVVLPAGGRYPADEAYFLHFIVHTVHEALKNSPQLDLRRFSAWIEERHAQVERGELIYIAHQLDYLARAAA